MHSNEDQKQNNQLNESKSSGSEPKVSLHHSHSVYDLKSITKDDTNCMIKSFSDSSLQQGSNLHITIKENSKNDYMKFNQVHQKKINPQCYMCDKIFSSKSSLKLHLKTIHNNFRFFCQICSKSYTQKASLRRHNSKFHPHFFLSDYVIAANYFPRKRTKNRQYIMNEMKNFNLHNNNIFKIAENYFTIPTDWLHDFVKPKKKNTSAINGEPLSKNPYSLNHQRKKPTYKYYEVPFLKLILNNSLYKEIINHAFQLQANNTLIAIMNNIIKKNNNLTDIEQLFLLTNTFINTN